ncbi:MAG: hypothetical protein WCD53_20780 [Microcoleus sp.]
MSSILLLESVLRWRQLVLANDSPIARSSTRSNRGVHSPHILSIKYFCMSSVNKNFIA